mmetsp:Transcript_2664/g.3022  ORF Transcript_2664/g.3022 Transcript_2664/m.3022 type:complete len:504 (+) Transcript_2664:175-1686(+)
MSDFIPPPPGPPPANAERLQKPGTYQPPVPEREPPPRYSMISFIDDLGLAPPPGPPPSDAELYQPGIGDDAVTSPPPVEPFQNVLVGLQRNSKFKKGQEGRAEIVINKPVVVGEAPKLIVPELRKVEQKEKPVAGVAKLVTPKLKKVEKPNKSEKKIDEVEGNVLLMGNLINDIQARTQLLDSKGKNKKNSEKEESIEFTDLPPIEDEEEDEEEEEEEETAEEEVLPPKAVAREPEKPKAAPKPQLPNYVKSSYAPIKDGPIEASPYEKEVYELINRARSDPNSMITFLKERLDNFVDGSNNLRTGPNMLQVTREGKAAVEEAIGFLAHQETLSKLTWNNDIANAAKSFVLDVGPAGKIGHEGTDGSKPQERVKKVFPQTAAAAESLKYYSNDALELVLSQIIDDGVPSRGNRKHLFGRWDYFGGYTGEHKSMNTMTALLYVQSEALGDSIIQEAVLQFEKDMGEPEGWVKKSQAISIVGNEIYITNSFIMPNGETKIVTNKN